jgi:hypothetical protein
MTSRGMTTLQALQTIADSGGRIPADVAAVAARFGWSRKFTRENFERFARMNLTAIELNGGQPMLRLEPAGFLAVSKAAKPKPLPPPTTVSAFLAAELAAQRAEANKSPPVAASQTSHVDFRAPLDEVLRKRFAKQGRMLRVLAKMRGVARIRSVDYQYFYRSAAELGDAAKLTEPEYRQIKAELGRFPDAWPEGYTEAQVRAVQREINLPLQAAAKHKRRVALAAVEAVRMQTVAAAHCRADAIYTVLTYPRYQTVAELTKAVMKALAPSFRTADGNEVLSGHSLRVAILRELAKPILADRVETKLELHRKGRPMYLFRRQTCPPKSR